MARLNSPYYLRSNFSYSSDEDDAPLTRLNLHKVNLCKKKSRQRVLNLIDANDALVYLNLSRTKLDSGICRSLGVLKRRLGNLETLNVSNNALDADSLFYLGQLVSDVDPCCLNLNANQLGFDSLQRILFDCDGLSNLCELKLRDNALDDDSALSLLDFLKRNPNVTDVDYGGNTFSDVWTEAIDDQLDANYLYLSALDAIENDDAEALLECLNDGLDLSFRSAHGYTLLGQAIYYFAYEATKVLLDAGIPLTDVCSRGKSALAYAKEQSDFIMVDLLKKHLNQKMHEAIKRGDLHAIALIEKQGGTVRMRRADSGWNMLHVAAMTKHLDVVKHVIQACPAFLTNANNAGQSPLQMLHSRPGRQDCLPIKRFLMHHMLSRCDKAISDQNADDITVLFESGLKGANLSLLERRLPAIIETKNTAILKTFLHQGVPLLSASDDIQHGLLEDPSNAFTLACIRFTIQQLKCLIAKNKLDSLKAYAEKPLMCYALEHCGRDLKQYAIDSNAMDVAEWCESRCHQWDQFYRVESLDMTYAGKKPHKTVLLHGEQIHRSLLLEAQAHEHSIRFKKTQGQSLNRVFAALSLISSNQPHHSGGPHGREVITVDIRGDYRYFHVEDFVQFRQTPTGSLRSAALFNSVRKSLPLSKRVSIDAAYNDPKSPRFLRQFHHSERALFAFLNDPKRLDDLIKQLHAKLKDQSQLKIYGAVIDLYSDHSLCENCGDSMPFWYGPQSEWMALFITKLRERGFVMPKDNLLSMTVRVSAKVIASNPHKGLVEDSQSTSDPVEMNSDTKHMGTVVIQKLISGPGSGPSVFVNQSANTRAKTLGRSLPEPSGAAVTFTNKR